MEGIENSSSESLGETPEVENGERAISFEDLQEMLDQIPFLQKMLEERRKMLEKAVAAEEIEALKKEISELEETINLSEDIKRKIEEYYEY